MDYSKSAWGSSTSNFRHGKINFFGILGQPSSHLCFNPIHDNYAAILGLSKALVFLYKTLTSLKFEFSEKHTKFEKIFLKVLTNQLIYLVNVKTLRKIFSNYVFFSKSPNFIWWALFESFRIVLLYCASYSGIPPLCAYLHFEQ